MFKSAGKNNPKPRFFSQGLARFWGEGQEHNTIDATIKPLKQWRYL
jgi:hypothetical protein